MKRILVLCILAGLWISCKNDSKGTKTEMPEPTGIDNVAYQWGEMALEATALDTERFAPRPTITSRYLGLIFTAVFDAWSRYDEKAIPVYLKGVDRRPTDEMTLRNKEIAISYAALRTMNEYYYSDKELFEKFMKEELGLDPNDTSTDPTTAVGVLEIWPHKPLSKRERTMGPTNMERKKVPMGSLISIMWVMNL